MIGKRGRRSSILVKYMTQIKSKWPKVSLQLHICNVVELLDTDTQLVPGSLYEMRARYPIVDAVGYLKETTSEEKWLVFIQLSVMMLQSSKEKRFVLQENVLYDLKRAHPIIICDRILENHPYGRK